MLILLLLLPSLRNVVMHSVVFASVCVGSMKAIYFDCVGSLSVVATDFLALSCILL